MDRKHWEEIILGTKVFQKSSAIGSYKKIRLFIFHFLQLLYKRFLITFFFVHFLSFSCQIKCEFKCTSASGFNCVGEFLVFHVQLKIFSSESYTKTSGSVNDLLDLILIAPLEA